MQNLTTGSIGGIVTDEAGEALPGVVVNAVHEPTDTQYNTVTRANGRFEIFNVRIGGPYKVTATMTGFKTQVMNDLFVKLGEALELTFELQLQTVEE